MQALRGSYRSLGDEYWAHLDEWLTSGDPIRRMNSCAEGETAYREQAAALAWMMAPAAAQAAAQLAPLLPRDASIIDLGAGSGIWSLALLTALPEATATFVDRPRRFRSRPMCRAPIPARLASHARRRPRRTWRCSRCVRCR